MLHEGKEVAEALMYADIEAARKLVKTHRCALTSERHFIDSKKLETPRNSAPA
jgi:hypothetical protein